MNPQHNPNNKECPHDDILSVKYGKNPCSCPPEAKHEKGCHFLNRDKCDDVRTCKLTCTCRRTPLTADHENCAACYGLKPCIMKEPVAGQHTGNCCKCQRCFKYHDACVCDEPVAEKATASTMVLHGVQSHRKGCHILSVRHQSKEKELLPNDCRGCFCRPTPPEAPYKKRNDNGDWCCKECFGPSQDGERGEYIGALPEYCKDETCECHDPVAEKGEKCAKCKGYGYTVENAGMCGGCETCGHAQETLVDCPKCNADTKDKLRELNIAFEEKFFHGGIADYIFGGDRVTARDGQIVADWWLSRMDEAMAAEIEHQQNLAQKLVATTTPLAVVTALAAERSRIEREADESKLLFGADTPTEFAAIALDDLNAIINNKKEI